VCRVTLVHGSGVASIDDAVRAAVRRWRFVPGKRGGEPVEAVRRFAVSLVIEGLNFN